MPRISKQPQQTKPSSLGLDVASLLAACRAEARLAGDVSRATRLGYEARGRLLAAGWDLARAAKGTRYGMKAAGQWVMRRQLGRLVREAEKVRKSGRTGAELFPVREAMFEAKLAEASALLDRIRDFQALPWSKPIDAMDRRQKSHKQRAASDAALEKFYEAAASSSFLDAFMVAEFSGCRGEEFGKGIRVEVGKANGGAVLSFFIESAKCDGKAKGIELRRIDVPFPSGASRGVQRRWLALAKKAAEGKGSFVCKIEPTKQAPGVRFTNAARFVKTKAGVDVMPYSLRHRYSAQVKEASGGDAVAVALALGHQSTETQRHYGRARRGGGGVSPVQAVGQAVSGEAIRGARQRRGPPLHAKEKIALGGVVKAIASPPHPRPRL